MPVQRTEFCLNVWIQNKQDVVKQQVCGKIGTCALGRATGHIAGSLVPVDEVATAVAEGLLKDLPEKLKCRGIRASCKLRFQKGPLLVFNVQVLSADLQKMAAGGEVSFFVAQAANCFQFLPQVMFRFATARVLEQVTAQMIPKIPDATLSDLRTQGGVSAKVTALRYEQEAEFLLDAIAAIEEEKAAAKGIKQSIHKFTGKESYKFGDISKELLHRAKHPASERNGRAALAA